MSKIREERVEKVIDICVKSINEVKLSEEELIIFLGQLIVRIGFSIYFRNKDQPSSIDKELAENLAFSDPTVGSSLIKLGFDVQEIAIKKDQ